MIYIQNKRAKTYKIEAVKSDDKWEVSYYVDNDKKYTETIDKVNGFGSIGSYIWSWNADWSCMGLIALKADYIPASKSNAFTVQKAIDDIEKAYLKEKKINLMVNR